MFITDSTIFRNVHTMKGTIRQNNFFDWVNKGYLIAGNIHTFDSARTVIYNPFKDLYNESHYICATNLPL